MKIKNLKTNNITEPLGYDFETLNFSWVLHEFVEHFYIKVFEDSASQKLIYKSDRIYYGTNRYDTYLELMPRKRYYWGLFDEEDQRISELSWYETSKLFEKWDANWISSSNLKENSIILRKDFKLEKEIASARLYVTGLGVYEAYLNSNRIGDEYLSPGYYSYDGYTQYQTFDVSHLITNGNNRLGVILGNGWYKGRFGFDGGYTDLYGDKLSLIAELHIAYLDGETEVILSDDTWTTCKSMILDNNIYDGEVVYGNHHYKDITSMPIDVSYAKTKIVDDFDKKPLIARRNIPVKVMETIEPIEMKRLSNGDWIFDYGQNMSGWVRFKVNEPKGKKVMLKYAEHYQDGDIYTDNLRTAKATFIYHSMGLSDVVRPKFTFFGFRYVKVSGIENPRKEDFVAEVVYSDMITTGKIETGIEKVNVFIQNTLWSQKGNFIDIPTDCPQRDERMGWTGDAQMFFKTAAYNMDVASFFSKYMFDLNYEQSLLEGAVPNIVPRLKLDQFDGFIDGYAATPWADAATIIPWNLYVMYGDVSLLELQFEGMKSWVDYASRECKKQGNEYLWTSGFHFADWLALDNHKNPESTLGGTDAHFVASVFYYYSTLLVSKAAKALGYNIYMDYQQKAENIKQAIVSEYFSKNGRITIDTQTARVLAIHFDLLPKTQLKRLGEELVNMIVENDMHLDTGFVGTPYICSALTKVGYSDYAYNLLLNEGFPGWLYPVTLGATTVWERWNSLDESGRISENGMNSLNHYAYGSVVQWIYEEVAGIKPLESYPGFDKFLIYPNINGRLKSIATSYDSVKGIIQSSWEVLNTNELRFEFRVPHGSSAKVRLPKPKKLSSFDGFNIDDQDNKYIYIVLDPGTYSLLYNPVEDFIPRFNLNATIGQIEACHDAKNIFEKYYGTSISIDQSIQNKPLIGLLYDYRYSKHMNAKKINKMEKELNQIVFPF